MTVRRTFWILSIANWLLAVATWAVSAYLGIARPTSLFIPTTLFVIGIFAVLAGTLCWVVARFGRQPEPSAVGEPVGERPVPEPAPAEEPAAETIPGAAPASEPAEAAATGVEPADGTAPAAEKPVPAEAG